MVSDSARAVTGHTDGPQHHPHPVQLAVLGWPIFLLFVGGAVGGLIGAGAAALNYRIMMSERTAVFRYGACFLVGAGAIVVFLLAALALYLMFPDRFGTSDAGAPVG